MTLALFLPAVVPDSVHGGVFIPYGNAGNLMLFGPGLVNFDFTLFKSLGVGETRRFELGSEFFNAFNHAQFLNPFAAINTGIRGRILNARDSRQIQMVLKFIF